MTKLTILIPVYNEEKYIKQIIEKVKEVKIEKEIIIIDDFSTDNTRKILAEINDKDIKIIYHNKNQGKGSAIRTGIKHATGGLTIIQDADLEYNPIEYINLIKPIINGNEDVVYGSRLLKGIPSLSHTPNKKLRLKLHYYGNKLLTFITNLLYGSKISDMETCYKVIRTDILKKIKLNSRRFDFEPEITAKLLKKGYKIYEIPINYSPRSFSEGKKIKTFDGVKALYYIIRYRFFD